MSLFEHCQYCNMMNEHSPDCRYGQPVFIHTTPEQRTEMYLDGRCKHIGQIRTGDEGQRYEVHGILEDGTDEIMGWTNHEDGGGLFKSAKLWPRYKDAYILDRKGGKP